MPVKTLSATAYAPSSGTFPGSTTYPGASLYPGRGTNPSAAAYTPKTLSAVAN